MTECLRQMNAMPNSIVRRLVYEDEDRQRKCIGQADIEAIDEPVVILGDPGLGKTVLAQTLGDRPGLRYCRAATFAREARPETLVAQGERIVVDGLDEIASSTPGGAVDSVLKKLSEMGHPPFILTCREADWRGAADRVQSRTTTERHRDCCISSPFRTTTPVPFSRTSFPDSMSRVS